MEKSIYKVFFKDTEVALPLQVLNLIPQIGHLKDLESGCIDMSFISSQLFSALVSFVSLEK